MSIVNVQESSIARESDGVLPTLAGPEIGVASTKAFTCQLTALASLAIAAGKARGHIGEALETELVQALAEVPRHMATVLRDEGPYLTLAHSLSRARDVLYLGRGQSYPIALEGALKLKEISYIHAEGYPAGEMKHGPIALIDERMPVVAIAPQGPAFEKMIGNMQEVKARGGSIIALTSRGDTKLTSILDFSRDYLLELPSAPDLLTPMVMVLPLQLLAYDIAVRRGCDVDQPRNLAKSVTVE